MPASGGNVMAAPERIAGLVDQARRVWQQARDQGRTSSGTDLRGSWTGERGVVRLQSTLKRFGVPAEYVVATRERCRVREAVEEFGGRIVEHCKAGRGLTIIGPVGVGKSSTAALLCGYAAINGLECRWWYTPTLLDFLLHAGDRREILRSVGGPELMVFDDLTVRQFGDFEVSLLDQVVERRYGLRRSTVVTTDSEELLTGDPRLARTVDRLRQRNAGLQIRGKSMRTVGAGDSA